MKVYFFLGFLLSCLSVNAQVISVEAYGAKANSFSDATPALKKSVEACKRSGSRILNFPKGRYDFWPDSATATSYYISNTSSEVEVPEKHQKAGIFLKDMNDLTVEGNGSLFVFHGKMITCVIDSCKNVELRNISINYERPGMSEMTLSLVSSDSVIADVHRDSRYAVIDGKVRWYGEKWQAGNFHAVLVRPSEDRLFYTEWDLFDRSSVSQLAPGRLLFKGNFKGFNGKIGDVLTVRDRYRDYVAAFINRSEGVSLKNIRMYSMHGLGIVSQFSANLTYDSVFIEPEKGSGRVIASSADGMHFSGCRGQITVSNCRFSGLHDDPINVHGTHLIIKEILSPQKIRVRFMHHQSYGFEAFTAGDSIAFVHPGSLQVFASGIVKSARLVSGREMVLDLSKALPLNVNVGDALENTTWTPALTIRNCYFERTISRGTLVSTRRKVLIENNTYYRTGMHAILIADDASGWYESGPVCDVTIRNNRFIECGFNSAQHSYAIDIHPEDHHPAKDYWVHKNINIENNEFTLYGNPLLRARSTDGLRFTGNKINQSATFTVSKPSPLIKLTNCRGVIIKNNRFYTNAVPSLSLTEIPRRAIKTDIPISKN